MRTVRDHFLVELEGRELASLEQLNSLFRAWLQQVYHARPQGETGEPPPRTGIDYLGLVEQRRRDEFTDRIEFRALPGDQCGNERDAGHDDDERGDIR